MGFLLIMQKRSPWVISQVFFKCPNLLKNKHLNSTTVKGGLHQIKKHKMLTEKIYLLEGVYPEQGIQKSQKLPLLQY
jgi:hypothetical protein